ncbi:MAG TPA: hypothetical protein VNQ80_07655 [Parapedobacter sp.]|uniref:hypothetical protein n=1 Tax=Parapedobacter sp. TaxID=1958893 RepID=UPI002B70C717|nr:hypothetical protein [Parapedobacter sp.]HWK57195.1 hypothetical protein [Parapedobacter sp.]
MQGKRKNLVTFKTTKRFDSYNQPDQSLNNFSISRITSFIPIVSGSFVILGMIRSFVYYESFGVSITKYIDFGEIFTLWFFETILSLMPFAFGLLIFLLFYLSTPKYDSGYNYRHSTPYLLYSATLLYYIFGIRKNIFGNYTEGLQHFLLNSIGHSIAFLFLLIGFVFFLFGMVSYFKTLNKRKRDGQELFSKTNGSMCIIMITCCLYIYFIVLPQGLALTSKNPDKYTLRFADRTISTDNNLRYLNRTKNYILLYDKSNNQTHIFKSEDVLEITIEPHSTIKLFEGKDI